MFKVKKLPRHNIAGKKFGYLIAIRVDHTDAQWRMYWLCICKCGNHTVTRYDALTSGATKSCGCYHKEKVTGKNSWKWTGHEEIAGWFWSSICKSAISRNLEFDITIKQIWDLFIKQHRKCAISNVLLTFPRTYKDKENRTASLDRIDSNQGYIINNIQWVHKIINVMKMDLPQEEFIRWCQTISAFNSQKKAC